MAQSQNRQFIPGLDLAGHFYLEAVKPILDERFPHLKYSAALIGSGSEVLGFDNKMSSDHHWGPRLMIFLSENDIAENADAIKNTLRDKLPRTFHGYPTSWLTPDSANKNIQLLDYDCDGPVNHRVELLAIRPYILQYLGFDIDQPIKATDWLTFPEQKLRTIISGRVFHDDLDLNKLRLHA